MRCFATASLVAVTGVFSSVAPVTVVMLATLATACGPSSSPSTTPRTGAKAPHTRPTRIVSVTLLSDELLWDMGDDVRARVVAVSALAEDPRWSTIAGRWPAALPRVTGTAEAILALDPDLVVLADFTADETKAALRGAGVEVLELSHLAGIDDLERNTRELAEAVDASAAADTLVQAWTQRAAGLHERCPDVKVTVWSEGFVAGEGTTFDDLCDRLGLVDIAAREGVRGHVKVPVESIVAWNPEWFVIPCAPEDEAAGCVRARETFAAQPGIADLAAVQRGQILAVPGRVLDTTGPALFDLADRLATACVEVR